MLLYDICVLLCIVHYYVTMVLYVLCMIWFVSNLDLYVSIALYVIIIVCMSPWFVCYYNLQVTMGCMLP